MSFSSYSPNANDIGNYQGGQPVSGGGGTSGAWGLLAQGIQDTVNLGWGIGQWIYNHREQRRQEQRADTAAQRYAADLRAAGLSPTLAAGGQSQTPAPIQASGESGMRGGADAIMTSIGIQMAHKDLEMRERINSAQVNKLNAETEFIKSTSPLRETQIGAETEKIGSQTTQLNIENEQLKQRLEAELKSIETQTEHTRDKIQMQPFQLIEINTQIDKINADIRHVQAQIELDRSRGKQIESETSIKRLQFLREYQQNLKTLRTGNMDKSFIGKIASDMVSALYGADNDFYYRQYVENFSRLSESILK